jgi:hypothetical protein
VRFFLTLSVFVLRVSAYDVSFPLQVLPRATGTSTDILGTPSRWSTLKASGTTFRSTSSPTKASRTGLPRRLPRWVSRSLFVLLATPSSPPPIPALIAHLFPVVSLLLSPDAANPDSSTKDLFDAIKAGNFPSWTVQVQVMSPEQAQKFRYSVLDLVRSFPSLLLSPLTRSSALYDNSADQSSLPFLLVDQGLVAEGVPSPNDRQV